VEIYMVWRMVRAVISTRNVEAKRPGTSICLQVYCGSYKHVAGWRVIKGLNLQSLQLCENREVNKSVVNTLIKL
jgi:hypothetical protein